MAIQTDRLSLDLPLDQGEQRRTQQPASRHVSHVAAEMGRSKCYGKSWFNHIYLYLITMYWIVLEYIHIYPFVILYVSM